MPASLPFSATRFARLLIRSSAALVFFASTAGAQPRPWLDWRTVETEHFAIHFPEQYRTWSMALAERIEGVRSQVVPIVGYSPLEQVHIVVDDPYNDANGEAFTPLDAPTIVLFPTPPSPRADIGNYRAWGEMVATHEFAHVAHLTRPSRNRWQDLLWSISPVPLGPVALNSPRWVLEGYATYVEGRASGSGRPNHAWRSAILRQFALEGRLPAYSQLSATGPWQTSNFAYLAGSAYLEWLARREGDSSVTALWRRMSARTNRSFDEAFVGVYGNGPAQLYGRFVAELTADALAFDRALTRDAAVPGTLVQRLSRNTGDPAISPDGRFVALTVRRIDAPSELVVWQTADEPDTSALRRRDQQLRADPEDVPDRSFYPAPKRVIISISTNDGDVYDSPRWMPDNRRLLVIRRMPLPDGSIRPDLFLWSAEDGALSRVTRGAALREADPSPDGRWAAATRCEHGWCDLVRVDLSTGAVRVILTGSPTRNYYRPRISRRTGEIVVAEQLGDRWRIARVDAANGTLSYADPNDGATRYDASYEADGRTIVCTSEAGGVANLERLSPDGTPTRLTAVTGAAVGGEPAPDGSIWFLSLAANGYDLRRVKPDSASINRARNATASLRLALVDSMSAVLPRTRLAGANDESRRPMIGHVSEDVPYEDGPPRLRYVPGASIGIGGSALQLGIFRSDPVGSLGFSLLGASGIAGLPSGLSLEVRDRSTRWNRIANAWASHEAPSRQYAAAYDEALDLSRAGGAVRLDRMSFTDGGESRLMLGALGEWQHASGFESNIRVAGIAGFSFTRRQRDEDSRYAESLSTLAEFGETAGGAYYRQRSTIVFGTGGNTSPLNIASVSYGSLAGDEGAARQRFVMGGFTGPLLDPALDMRRVDAPAYPVASAASRSFISYRVATPFPPMQVFYSGTSPDMFKTALRSYGAEIREHVAAVPALGTPEVDALAGFARAVDEPVKGEWRYYVTVSLHP